MGGTAGPPGRCELPAGGLRRCAGAASGSTVCCLGRSVGSGCPCTAGIRSAVGSRTVSELSA